MLWLPRAARGRWQVMAAEWEGWGDLMEEMGRWRQEEADRAAEAALAELAAEIDRLTEAATEEQARNQLAGEEVRGRAALVDECLGELHRLAAWGHPGLLGWPCWGAQPLPMVTPEVFLAAFPVGVGGGSITPARGRVVGGQ